MTAPAVLGESALLLDESMRHRAASIFASDAGCTVLVFSAPDLETLVGYAPHTACIHNFNLKMLQSVSVGQTPLLVGLDKVRITIAH